MVKNGSLGELAAMKHFAQLGFEIYAPIADCGQYDFLLLKDDKVSRVEVKSATYMRGDKYEVQLKKVRANKTVNTIHYFDNSQLDLLVIYIEPEDRIVVFNAKEVRSRTTMMIAAATRIAA